jgi:hypothetical protein
VGPAPQPAPPSGRTATLQAALPKWFHFIAWVIIVVGILIGANATEDMAWYWSLLPGLSGAILVYTDANEIGVQRLTLTSVKLGATHRWTPGDWGLLVAIFWVLFLPWYMIVRKPLAGYVAMASQAPVFQDRKTLKEASRANPGVPVGGIIPGQVAA